MLCQHRRLLGTHPPVIAFIVLSIVGMLPIAPAPLAALSVWTKAEVTSPKADPISDATINAKTRRPDLELGDGAVH